MFERCPRVAFRNQWYAVGRARCVQFVQVVDVRVSDECDNLSFDTFRWVFPSYFNSPFLALYVEIAKIIINFRLINFVPHVSPFDALASDGLEAVACTLLFAVYTAIHLSGKRLGCGLTANTSDSAHSSLDHTHRWLTTKWTRKIKLRDRQTVKPSLGTHQTIHLLKKEVNFNIPEIRERSHCPRDARIARKSFQKCHLFILIVFVFNKCCRCCC